MKVSKWKRLSSKTCFRNKWITIKNDQFLLPNNKVIDFCIFERKSIVAILPITADNKVVLVEQYRPAVGEKTIDIPGGSIKEENDETPLNAAIRELKEETGYSAKTIYQIGKTFFPDSGKTNHVRHIFVAEDLIRGKSNREKTEFLKTKKIPIQKLVKLIIAGELKDSTVCLAVLMYWSNNILNITKYKLETKNQFY